MQLDTKVISERDSTNASDEVKIYNLQSPRKYYFQNPIRVGEECPVCYSHHVTEIRTFKCYRRLVFDRMTKDPAFKKAIKYLYGKILVCVCKPSACHGDVLAEAAQRLHDLDNNTTSNMNTPEKEVTNTYSSSKPSIQGKALAMVNGKPAKISTVQSEPMKVEVVKDKPVSSTTTTTTEPKAKISGLTIPDPKRDEKLKVILRDDVSPYSTTVAAGRPQRLVLFKDDHSVSSILTESYSANILAIGKYCGYDGKEHYQSRIYLSEKHVRALLPYLTYFAENGRIAPVGAEKEDIEEIQV